jgi:hypothetical protein
MNSKLYLLFLLPVFFFIGCHEDESDKTGAIIGFWQQEKITEDGVEINLPAEQKSLGLLFESNGVYRTCAKDMPDNKEHFGAWTITDGQWLEMTVDTWRLNAGQWTKNHIPVRFSILKLSDNELEIRVKTYIGEKKYAALFVEIARPPVTSENLDAIQQEYMTLKTYIYTFKKANN